MQPVGLFRIRELRWATSGLRIVADGRCFSIDLDCFELRFQYRQGPHPHNTNDRKWRNVSNALYTIVDCYSYQHGLDRQLGITVDWPARLQCPCLYQCIDFKFDDLSVNAFQFARKQRALRSVVDVKENSSAPNGLSRRSLGRGHAFVNGLETCPVPLHRLGDGEIAALSLPDATSDPWKHGPVVCSARGSRLQRGQSIHRRKLCENGRHLMSPLLSRIDPVC